MTVQTDEYLIGITAKLAIDITRQIEALGIRKCFQSGGDISAIAQQTLCLIDHIIPVDTNPSSDPITIAHPNISIDERRLDIDHAPRRLDDARKLYPDTIQRRYYRYAFNFKNLGSVSSVYGFKPCELLLCWPE